MHKLIRGYWLDLFSFALSRITTNLAAWKTHIYHLKFIAQQFTHGSTRSSVQGSHQVLVSAAVLLQGHWGKICFQAFLDCWQNSSPCGCRTEVSIFLLAISQRPLTALTDCLLYFAIWPSHRHEWPSFNMAAYFSKPERKSLLLQDDITYGSDVTSPLPYNII